MIYQPAEDSFLLEKYVKKFSKNKSVLDVGSGCGIQAKAAILSGAKSVLAIDINPESVDYIKKAGIHTIKSNLFSKVKGKFDLIIFKTITI
jgi:methylase of polypeptide subunit release factors